MHGFYNALSLDNLGRLDNSVAAVFGGSIGMWLDLVYGSGRSSVILALLAVIALDWVTGIAAAHKDRSYSTEYGIAGVFRTIFILAFPAFANVLDHALGTPGLLFYAVTFGLIYHTYISLTANAARAGWSKYIPQAVLKFVASEIKAKAERTAGRKGGA